jgi:DNA-binding MarR family transcriptional regulator
MIRRAARRVTQIYDEALAPTGLRITQYSLLANLDRRGPIAMTDLAAALGMDRTTLTRNIRPLERDGLLTLRAAGHGRTKLVTLSARGRRRLREAFPYWEQAQQQFGEAIGTQSVRDLAQLASAIQGRSAGRDSTPK